MEMEKELEQRVITIAAVSLEATEFVLKVQLLKCGPILEYTNKNGQGVRQQLIFVDEEGTKIQTALFGASIEKWKAILESRKVYYVINGIIRGARFKINNVNKVKELSITQFTEIKECFCGFRSLGFSNNFCSLDNIEQLDKESYHDVAGVIIEISGLKVSGDIKRRVTTITNESHERVSVTLWGEIAEHDGMCLDATENCKSVVAFCNVKITEFRGTLGFASTKATTVFVDPKIEIADQLQQWSRYMIATDVDITSVSSRQMERAIELKIPEMLDTQKDNIEIVYCKFNVTVKQVLRKDSVCYKACKKCYRKVKILGSGIYCDNCVAYQDAYTYRYNLHLLLEYESVLPNEGDKTKYLSTNCESSVVSVDADGTGFMNIEDITSEAIPTEDNGQDLKEKTQENTITVKVFEAAKYLIGCSGEEYMASIAEKKQDSYFYENLISSEGRKYSFLVKNYHKHPIEERSKNMVIEEMQLIGHGVITDKEESTPSAPEVGGKRHLEDMKADETTANQSGKKGKTPAKEFGKKSKTLDT